MCGSLYASQLEKDKQREDNLILAFRQMPEAAREMMLRVAQSYEKEPLEQEGESLAA